MNDSFMVYGEAYEVQPSLMLYALDDGHVQVFTDVGDERLCVELNKKEVKKLRKWLKDIDG